MSLFLNICPYINIIEIALLGENRVMHVEKMPKESLRLSKPLRKLIIVWCHLNP